MKIERTSAESQVKMKSSISWQGILLRSGDVFVKIPKSGMTEIYITDERGTEGIYACPDDLKIVFKLFVCSGNRLIHLYRILQHFDENNVVIDGEIAHYSSSEFPCDNKRTFQVFFPTAYLPEIKSFNSPDQYKTISKKLQIGRVSPKRFVSGISIL